MAFMYHDDHGTEYCEGCGADLEKELLADAEWEGIEVEPGDLPLIGHTMLEGEKPFTCASCGEVVTA